MRASGEALPPVSPFCLATITPRLSLATTTRCWFFGMVHHESAEGIQLLLRKAYDAMAPGASVYIMEMMADPSNTAPKFSALFAVNMALTTDFGWVFSSADSALAGKRDKAELTFRRFTPSHEFDTRAIPAPRAP